MVKEGMKVSILQMSSVIGDIDANCAKVEKIIKQSQYH